jgi:hypothetical protein
MLNSGDKAALGAAVRVAALSHLRQLATLQALADLLSPSGVPWLVVKGPVLAELAHRRAGLRTSADLDLVVPASAFRGLAARLDGAGLRLADPSWRFLLHTRSGQVNYVDGRGQDLDIHWHLINEPSRRRSLRVPMASLFHRAKEARLGSLPVMTLDETDTLLHVLMHAALSGGHRLIWFKDVERLAARRTPDWEALVARARDWGIAGAAGLILPTFRPLSLMPCSRTPHGND